MAHTPAIGFGGKLEIDVAYPSTPSWVEIGHVVDFNTNIDVAEVDVTHQQSASAAPWWAEFIPGKVSVELSFTCNFDPGVNEHEDTILDEISIMRQFKYTFKDGSVWTFVGFYRTSNLSMPNEDKLAGDVSVRVTGAPTFAGAA